MKHALLCFFLPGIFSVSGQQPGQSVTAKDDATAGVVTVEISGNVFTELHYKKYAKPVWAPIIGPTGAKLTRQWPMTDAAPGEEKDHPHHKGLTFTHGAVNGVDFWAEGEKMGKIVVRGRPEIQPGKPSGVTIKTTEDWKALDGRTVCTSVTSVNCDIDTRVGEDGVDRFIDYTITLNASEGDVTLGDTKEGTMGIRSHPALNLKGKVATGRAENSEGQKGMDKIWGKHARWVDYSGTVDGKVTGIACFDHPGNLRHPTTWHARDYGLIAANPFGLHDFEKKEKGAGDHVIKKGESLTLRYRWLFHTGDTAAAKIEERWKQWAGK